MRLGKKLSDEMRNEDLNQSNNKKTIAVVGAGPIGKIAAIHLAQTGDEIVLIGPSPPEDARTTAIMDDGIKMLDTINVWPSLKDHAAALRSMRIVDGTKRLIRTPEARYDASEIGLEAFGYNIQNRNLNTTLEQELNNCWNIQWVREFFEDIKLSNTTQKTLNCASGKTVNADLIVAADGRNSRIRDLLQIKTKAWSYPQTALVLNVEHTRPHDNVSTEFHTESGPFTLVPLPGKRSSLVWVEKPEQAAEIVDWDDEHLARFMSEKSHHLLGDLKPLTRPVSFPLSGLMASQFGKDGTVLIGETGHAFPPIGAQGMNLGIRDVRTLYELLSSQKHGADMAALAGAYSTARKSDVRLRTGAVDLLNRSLLTDFLPIHLGRGLGLYASEKVPFFRKFLMSRGLGTQPIT